MPLPVNELGEFVMHDEVDGEFERRQRIYASCVKVDPKKAKGPTVCFQPKQPREPEFDFCEECGASFEKKRYNQRFCSRVCQKRNYNAERRDMRKFRNGV